MFPALVAAALVAAAQLLGWKGVDTAAQVYRVDAFRRWGFSLWDFQWYGGHWTLDYSLLYPVLAGVAGVGVVAVASAAVAAGSFDRLSIDLGAGGRAAAWVFAAGTVVPAAIGQLTFLSGEAFGLAALWAASRRHSAVGAVLALACALTSPLTGAFLALGATAWALSAYPRRSRPGAASYSPGLVLVVASLAPVLAGAALFPGDGPMPYPAVDWAWEMVVAGALALLAGRRHLPIAIGSGMFMVVATVAEIVASPLGGNVGRIEDMVALPLGVALAWQRTALLVPLAAVPLALSQWTPAWGAMTSAGAAPSTHRVFFTALDRQLEVLSAAGPPGRVEVVPTQYHWEAAYVAPVMPLARGWERQLDTAYNPIFYHPGLLTPAAYRAWLLENGVRYVALASAPLDMAGEAEGALVASGRVPGLDLIWRSPSWRLYRVQGGSGIVSGPARLLSASHGRVVLDTTSAGPVTIRIRYSPDWVLGQGQGCLERDRPSWMRLQVPGPETVTLHLSLTGGGSRCTSSSLADPPGRRGGPGA